jgi:hypothetical protein
MRTSRTALGILAAGVTAIAIAATPAIAATASGMGNGNGTGTCTATGQPAAGQQNMNGTNGMGNRGPGRGNGQGMGNRGPGLGMAGQGAITAPMGTLTVDQKAELAAMAEEEKVAHDLYVALAEDYPELRQFANIAKAELQHLTAVRTLMDRYGIDDPTAGYADGTFKTKAFQAMYDNLLKGATDSTKALAAGIAVEQADIADLKAATAGVTAPDVLQVYTNLLRGSERHLAAFGG